MSDGIDFLYGYIKLMTFILKASLDYECPITSDTVNNVEILPACHCDPGESHRKSPVVAV